LQVILIIVLTVVAVTNLGLSVYRAYPNLRKNRAIKAVLRFVAGVIYVTEFLLVTVLTTGRVYFPKKSALTTCVLTIAIVGAIFANAYAAAVLLLLAQFFEIRAIRRGRSSTRK
jgi:hypothetical protein